MAQKLISTKYLSDIAEAIRVKLGSQATYTPAQMAAAIANITGTISGTITPSTRTDTKVITDTYLGDIAAAIRTKLNVQTSYVPSEMANAILSISASPVIDIVPWATGTDAQIVAMLQAAHNGDIDLQTDGGWAVGDTRTISISAFTGQVAHAAQDMDLIITSFSDYNGCGCVMQFDFKDCLAEAEPLGSATYASSNQKSKTYPALVGALPTWLANSLITFTVKANVSGSSYNVPIDVTNNKLAMRATSELQGAGTTNPDLGAQVDYYIGASSLCKKRLGKTGSYSRYWTRTGTSTSNYVFRIESNGSRGSARPTNSYGISAFGCL